MFSFSAWNHQQFKEYMYKANQYGTAVVRDSSDNIAQLKTGYSPCKRIDNDSFFSLPGVPLSDETPLEKEDILLADDNLVVATAAAAGDLVQQSAPHISKPDNSDTDLRNCKKTKFGFLQTRTCNTKNSLESCDGMCNDDSLNSHHPVQTMNNNEAYSQAASNLKSFIQSLKYSKYNTFTSFSTDFRNAILSNDSASDKSVQTSVNHDDTNNTIKQIDKANQTIKVKTKNTGISTDPNLLHSWYQDYLSSSMSTEVTRPQPPGRQESTTTRPRSTKKTGRQHLRVAQGDTPATDSPPRQRTSGKLVTRPAHDSKLASFNDILANIGRRLLTPTVTSLGTLNKTATADTSFWDNPLDNSQLEPPSTRSQPLCPRGTSITRRPQPDCKPEGDSVCLSEAPVRLPISASAVLQTIQGQRTHQFRFPSELRTRTAFDQSATLRYSKSFLLNPYDDLVKSHFSPFDRRIKSVSAKNGSTINIEGPLTPPIDQAQHQNHQHLHHNHLPQATVVYRCTIASSNQENLDKCVNYLKETFPNTYLRSGIKNPVK